MKEIAIEHLQKTFFTLRRGKIEALKDVHFTIGAGKFFVLLGPSGCGKSTLLNIIAGIEKPTAGEIRIGKRIVASVPQRKFLTPRQRDVAMVFQSYALYPHLSVFDNIAFPLKIAKTDKQKIKERVESVAATLEISRLLDAKPKELSGGQRQRVALGRAIIRQPNVLLLDEPLSNLDALLRISMRSELKQIQRQIGVTTIYVTHDQTEALSLGDQVAVMKAGEVQQIAAPEQIYHDPVNLFVAKFVGTPPMNFLSGSILEMAKKPIPLDLHHDKAQVTLGLRPEHIRIVEEQESIFQGKLTLFSTLGSEKLLYIKIKDNELLVKTGKDISLKEGDSVGITFDKEHLYLFDKDGKRTGKRRQETGNRR